MCDRKVCVGELMPYVVPRLWARSHVRNNVFLPHSPEAPLTPARCQTHGTLTRYWSRWRSVSGVNSEDMGMISPFLTMMALQRGKRMISSRSPGAPMLCSLPAWLRTHIKCQRETFSSNPQGNGPRDQLYRTQRHHAGVGSVRTSHSSELMCPISARWTHT